MPSVLCMNSFDLHRIQNKRIAELLSPPKNLNAGTWVCLETSKKSSL